MGADVDRPSPLDGFPRGGVVAEDWSGVGAPLDLMSGAGVLGALAYVERELHAVVGGWALYADDSDTVLFDVLAQHHSWRSERLVDRLPQLRELPASVVVVSPGPATDDLLTALGALDVQGADRHHVQLAAWTAVAAGLLDAHEALLLRCTPVADAPLLRWLPLLVDSVRSDQAAATAAFSGTTADRSAIEDLVAGSVRFTR